MSVDSFCLILSVLSNSVLSRDLKYLLKIPYFIQNSPNVVEYLIFETLCLGRSKTLTCVFKKYHKNEPHLFLVKGIFTKLSQNLCLINTHICMYQYVRCDCKLWNALWFYCVFWVFSYIIDDNSCLKYCTFTKLSWIVYVPNVTASYGGLSDSIAFFWDFSCITFLELCNFIIFFTNF